MKAIKKYLAISTIILGFGDNIYAAAGEHEEPRGSGRIVAGGYSSIRSVTVDDKDHVHYSDGGNKHNHHARVEIYGVGADGRLLEDDIKAALVDLEGSMATKEGLGDVKAELLRRLAAEAAERVLISERLEASQGMITGLSAQLAAAQGMITDLSGQLAAAIRRIIELEKPGKAPSSPKGGGGR